MSDMMKRLCEAAISGMDIYRDENGNGCDWPEHVVRAVLEEMKKIDDATVAAGFDRMDEPFDWHTGLCAAIDAILKEETTEEGPPMPVVEGYVVTAGGNTELPSSPNYRHIANAATYKEAVALEQAFRACLGVTWTKIASAKGEQISFWRR